MLQKNKKNNAERLEIKKMCLSSAKKLQYIKKQIKLLWRVNA